MEPIGADNHDEDEASEMLATSLSDYFLLQYDLDALYRKWGSHQAYVWLDCLNGEGIVEWRITELNTSLLGVLSVLRPIHILSDSPLNKNFQEVCTRIPGLRLLRQDPLETLFSFICSQNNNIPRIKQLIDKICRQYGDLLDTHDGVDYYAFPTLQQLSKANEDELNALGFGYRSKYIVKSIAQVNWMSLD